MVRLQELSEKHAHSQALMTNRIKEMADARSDIIGATAGLVGLAAVLPAGLG